MLLQKNGNVLGELERLAEETKALMTSLEDADMNHVITSASAELQAIHQRALAGQRERTFAMLETLESLAAEDSAALLDGLYDSLSPTAPCRQ